MVSKITKARRKIAMHIIDMSKETRQLFKRYPSSVDDLFDPDLGNLDFQAVRATSLPGKVKRSMIPQIGTNSVHPRQI